MESENKKDMSREALESRLPEKRIRFCREYIIDYNGARSAREAGYSEHTARTIASDLLTNTDVKAYIQLIKHNYEENCGITKTRILNELEALAFSSVTELSKDWIELQEFETLKKKFPKLLKAIESTETKTEYLVREDKLSDEKELIEVKYVRVKLHSKLKAIEIINRMLDFDAATKTDITSGGKPLEPTKVEFINAKRNE